MDGILNEVTNTVHRREVGTSALETPCGVTHNLPEEQLRTAALDQIGTTTTTRCGRCFDDGGGY